VREPQFAVDEVDDPGVHCLRHEILARDAEDGVQDVDCRPRDRRRHLQHLLDSRRLDGQTLVHQLAERRGHGKRLARARPRLATVQRARKLQREERIAARRIHNLPQHRPREDVDVRPYQPVEGTEAEGTDADANEPRLVERERRAPVLAAAGEEE
jgi:hypothetical protein